MPDRGQSRVEGALKSDALHLPPLHIILPNYCKKFYM